MNYSTDGRLDEIRKARGYSFEDQVRGKFILIYSYSIALCTSSSLTDHLLARVPPRLRYQAEELFPGASAHRRRDSVRARGPRIFRRSRVSFVKGSLTVIRTASPNAFPSEPKIMCRVSRGNCPWAFPAGQPWISRNHAVWLRSTTFPSHFTNGPAHMPRPPLPSFLAPISPPPTFVSHLFCQQLPLPSQISTFLVPVYFPPWLPPDSTSNLQTHCTLRKLSPAPMRDLNVKA